MFLLFCINGLGQNEEEGFAGLGRNVVQALGTKPQEGCVFTALKSPNVQTKIFRNCFDNARTISQTMGVLLLLCEYR